jgi:arylsulfatase A-like enzyme
LQLYGYRHRTTPHLASLAARGITFTNAHTQANETQTSHAVMLSGLYSHLNLSYRNQQRWSLPAGYKPLAQMLADAGFRTQAVTSFAALTPKMIGDGFARFSVPDGRERRSSETNEVIFDTLDDRDGRSFLWVHYFDAHEPYDPPRHYRPPFSSRGYDRPSMYGYDCELSYLDTQLGALIDFLRRTARYDDAAILITSDHGEHFGETPGLPLESHFGLYSDILQAPLVLAGGWVERWRSASDVPRTCAHLVSSGITVAPTVLEWAGVNPPRPLSGYSLLRIADGREASPGVHLAESDSQMQVAIISGGFKLIVLDSERYREDLRRLEAHDPNVYITASVLHPIRDVMTADGLELYDLQADPGERVNLAGRAGAEVDRHLRILAQLRRPDPGRAPVTPSSDRLDILRSLGYIR